MEYKTPKFLIQLLKEKNEVIQKGTFYACTSKLRSSWETLYNMGLEKCELVEKFLSSEHISRKKKDTLLQNLNGFIYMICGNADFIIAHEKFYVQNGRGD